MAITRKGLIDFKKEVEQELLFVKQEWLNSVADTFLKVSPYDTGFFINQTDIKIGSRSNSFDVNYNHKLKRSSKFDNNKILKPYGRKVTTRIEFKINRPYDKISISNFVYYNEQIETSGWGRKTAYRPFLKTYKIAEEKLHYVLADINGYSYWRKNDYEKMSPHRRITSIR